MKKLLIACTVAFAFTTCNAFADDAVLSARVDYALLNCSGVVVSKSALSISDDIETRISNGDQGAWATYRATYDALSNDDCIKMGAM